MADSDRQASCLPDWVIDRSPACLPSCLATHLPTRGVAWRAEDEHARARCEGVRQLLRGEEEGGGGVRGEDDRRGAHQARHLGVGHPVRRGDEDLVARRAHGQQGLEDGLLGAVA